MFGGLLQLFQGGYRGFESRWGHHRILEARYQFGSGLFVTEMPGFELARVRS